jgi:ABC-type lipoprotein export system ATPase subunit
VQQSLQFTARLRLPRAWREERKMQQVALVMETLRITKCKVGSLQRQFLSPTALSLSQTTLSLSLQRLSLSNGSLSSGSLTALCNGSLQRQDTKIADISGGERKRLCIAQVLLSNGSPNGSPNGSVTAL